MTRNIPRTTNHQQSKYPEKFNDVKEGKKPGPEIAYRQTHSYGLSAFEYRDSTVFVDFSLLVLKYLNYLKWGQKADLLLFDFV